MKNKESQDFPYNSNPISIIEIILVLARNSKLILITPTIFCTYAIMYVLFIARPVYSANAKIISSSGSGNVSQVSEFASQFGFALPSSQTRTQWVYPEIIKSRTLSKVMLNQKFDTDEFGEQKTLLQILTYGNNPAPNLDKETLIIKATKTFIGMLEISENIKTGIYTLIVNASEPQLAVDICTVLINELDKHQKDYNSDKLKETRKFIQERIIDTKNELELAEDTHKIFLDRNRRIENSPALQLELQRLSREVTVLTGVFTTLKSQLETAKIEEVKEKEYIIILDPPELPLDSIKPKKKRTVILAGILGIGIGILFAFLKEFIVRSIIDEGETLYKIKTILKKNIVDLLFFYKK